MIQYQLFTVDYLHDQPQHHQLSTALQAFDQNCEAKKLTGTGTETKHYNIIKNVFNTCH